MHTKQTYRSAGFTIVELLIVIVVIGILAAVTIVAFNGVQTKANTAALKSDIKNAVTQLANGATLDSTYLSGLSASGGDLKKSPTTTYQFTYTSSSVYCLTATSSKSGVPAFNYLSTRNTIIEGVCTGHSATPAVAYTPSTGITSDLAGTGTAGGTNTPSSSAQFDGPIGIVVASNGDAYITEYLGNRIRKIAADGTISTVAGSGSSGSTNGTGTAASFNAPRGITIDTAGNLYVSDTGNNLIRKITSAGVVTTFAGSGYGGPTSDGTGTSASFSNPRGIAIDSNGTNLYVADTAGYTIRKIVIATGVVTTIAGSSTSGYNDANGTSARFTNPYGIAVGTDGTVYVTEQSNQLIRKISPSGVVGTVAGTYSSAGSTNGTGTAASFNQPSGVAIGTDNTLYIADSGNNLIRKITSAGVVTTLAGSGTAGSANGNGTAAQFNTPYGIAIGPDGALYVSDTSGNKIRKLL